jgi:hypothetical protein
MNYPELSTIPFIHNATREFRKKWAYFYERLFYRIFGRTKYPVLAGYLTIVVIDTIETAWVDKLYSASQTYVYWWWYYLFVWIIVGHAFWALYLAKDRLRRDLPYFLALIRNEDDRLRFLGKVWLMGDSGKQAVFCILFGLFGGVLVLFQSFVGMPLGIRLHAAVHAFIALTVTTTGLWLAITSALMTRHLTRIKNLKLDFIVPARTPGLKKLASMMAFYATLFVIQVSLWEIPSLLAVLSVRLNVPNLDTNTMSFRLAASLLAFFLLVVLLYFVFPQAIIRNLVNNYRDGILSNIQASIYEEIWGLNPFGFVREPGLEHLLKVYTEIKSSQNNPLPFPNLIQFGISFVASLALSLFTNTDLLVNAFFSK